MNKIVYARERKKETHLFAGALKGFCFYGYFFIKVEGGLIVELAQATFIMSIDVILCFFQLEYFYNERLNQGKFGA